MNGKGIRLSAIVLATSAIILMTSANETQALERLYTFCMSGRCVKATGSLVVVNQGQIIMHSPAIVMVDLVNRYIAVDHPGLPWPGSRTDGVTIHYDRFRIHVYGPSLEFHAFVGIPGGAIALAELPGGTARVIFIGFASFYNGMEFVPY